MELLHGSPMDMTGREEREVRAYRFLDEIGVDFERTDHPDEPATSMEACAKIDPFPDQGADGKDSSGAFEVV